MGVNKWVSIVQVSRRPEEGPVRIKLLDGSEKDAWFSKRKRIFVSPDGAVGYDPIEWKQESS